MYFDLQDAALNDLGGLKGYFLYRVNETSK
jgi:hypothetical protein